jgi:hypothetical protein
LQVAAVARADAVLGRRSGFQPLWEAEQFRPGAAGSASGVGPLGEGLGTALIVAGDPLRDGADTTAEGLGDRGGGAALEGEDESLVAEPIPLASDGLGQVLEFVEGQVVVDVPGEAPGVGPKSLIFTGS